VHFARGQAYEAKYVIRTEEPHLTPVDAVQAYKELSEVERGFGELKDVIELRPIYHRRKERVQAHIFIAALAFLLDRALEKKLKAARVAMSAAEALKALRTVLVVGPTRKRGVTGGSARARQVLAALDITEREPPRRPGNAGHGHPLTIRRSRVMIFADFLTLMSNMGYPRPPGAYPRAARIGPAVRRPTPPARLRPHPPQEPPHRVTRPGPVGG
jgi:Transposase DDE domain